MISSIVFGPMGEPEKMPHIIKTFVLNSILAVVIYLLNKRAVAKEIVPRPNKMDQLIDVMEKS